MTTYEAAGHMVPEEKTETMLLRSPQHVYLTLPFSIESHREYPLMRGEEDGEAAIVRGLVFGEYNRRRSGRGEALIRANAGHIRCPRDVRAGGVYSLSCMAVVV